MKWPEKVIIKEVGPRDGLQINTSEFAYSKQFTKAFTKPSDVYF